MAVIKLYNMEATAVYVEVYVAFFKVQGWIYNRIFSNFEDMFSHKVYSAEELKNFEIAACDVRFLKSVGY